MLSLTIHDNHAYDASKPLFPGAWYLHLIICFLLFTGTCIFYFGDLELGFFSLDDSSYILENPLITELSGKNTWSILTRPYAANYSPLHILSYSIDHALGGMNARVFHWSSNIWAGMVTVMVYLTALSVLGNWLAAIAASLLFMVHPAHVEVIAWISNRKDLIASAFGLASLIFYILYRRTESGTRSLYYILSLIFFGFGEAGKQSIIVLPAIYLVFDLLLEKRKGWKLFLDKIPFILVALWFAVQVMEAQPPTRRTFSLYLFGYVLSHYVWLVTGFADYVIYRPKPAAFIPSPITFIYISLPIIFVVVPFLMRRKLPALVLVFVYWFYLSLVPTQVLSFVHPVSDRYLFFPSVASVMLIALIIARIANGRIKYGFIPGLLIFAVVMFVWITKTSAYLKEWKDPRSVWYTAVQKSNDANNFFYLGSHYQDIVSEIDISRRNKTKISRTVFQFAEKHWEHDPRLQQLSGEFDDMSSRDAISVIPEFQKDVNQLAWSNFEEAVQYCTTVMPNLFFRRGKLLLDNGDPDSAQKEFEKALEQSRKHTSETVQKSLFVHCNYALGVIAWIKKDYAKAQKLIQLADETQSDHKIKWVPELPSSREKIDKIVQSLEGKDTGE